MSINVLHIRQRAVEGISDKRAFAGSKYMPTRIVALALAMHVKQVTAWQREMDFKVQRLRGPLRGE